jgi:hypothetical protein
MEYDLHMTVGSRIRIDGDLSRNLGTFGEKNEGITIE